MYTLSGYICGSPIGQNLQLSQAMCIFHKSEFCVQLYSLFSQGVYIARVYLSVLESKYIMDYVYMCICVSFSGEQKKDAATGLSGARKGNLGFLL